MASSRAAHEVVDQITFAIRSGIFSPGEQIPHIDQLAREMQVSKVTVGEAIRILSNAGVLKSRRGLGGGTTVQSNNIPATVLGLGSSWRGATLHELVDARRAVEVHIAVLASTRASQADFAAMERAIELLREHLHEHYTVRIHYDHLFHYAMARASGSRLLARYQHEILERLFIQLRKDFAEFGDMKTIITLHCDTLAAMQSRNPDRARRAMEHHLHFVELTVEKRQPAQSKTTLKRPKGKIFTP